MLGCMATQVCSELLCFANNCFLGCYDTYVSKHFCVVNLFTIGSAGKVGLCVMRYVIYTESTGTSIKLDRTLNSIGSDRTNRFEVSGHFGPIHIKQQTL